MTDTPKPFVFADTGEARRFAPATQRNREAISDVLADILPSGGLALEIASGTGEHVIHFAARFPGLIWQPSDDDNAGIASIESWRADVDLPNILPAIRLDASAPLWPTESVDAILCINMIHISPWAATVGLMSGAGRVLASGGILYLYGPYRETGVETAKSNEAFDQSLKMPANNLSLVFRRS
jgi:SAM-dependent methyltransferase